MKVIRILYKNDFFRQLRFKKEPIFVKFHMAIDRTTEMNRTIASIPNKLIMIFLAFDMAYITGVLLWPYFILCILKTYVKYANYLSSK